MHKLVSYWKILLPLFIVIIGIFWWSARSSQQKKAAAVETVTVRREDFVKVITSSGKTKADKSVSLTFQTAGRLAWVRVKEGDSVRAHQAIAGLDQREVQKNLEKALTDYSIERNDFDETYKVTYRGIKPADALNDTMKRILEKNQWNLDKAILDVELKHLAVEYSTLATPIAGIMTRVDTPVAGVNITPATAVFTVSDPNSLVFEASVDETDIANITIGQPAAITLDAYPDASFSGTISYVSFTSQQSSGGATVFPVKVSFERPDNLRVGLNGDIAFETLRQSSVLTVPTEAILEENGTQYVYIKSGKTYAKTPVKTGGRNEEKAVVTDGLAEGDEIVTKGYSSLQ